MSNPMNNPVLPRYYRIGAHKPHHSDIIDGMYLKRPVRDEYTTTYYNPDIKCECRRCISYPFLHLSSSLYIRLFIDKQHSYCSSYDELLRLSSNKKEGRHWTINRFSIQKLNGPDYDFCKYINEEHTVVARVTPDNHIIFPGREINLKDGGVSFVKPLKVLPIRMLSLVPGRLRMIHLTEYKRELLAYNWEHVHPLSSDNTGGAYWSFNPLAAAEFKKFEASIGHKYFPGIKFDMSTGECLNPNGILTDKKKVKQWKQLISIYRKGIKMREKLGVLDPSRYRTQHSTNGYEPRFAQKTWDWRSDKGAKLLFEAILNCSYDQGIMVLLSRTTFELAYREAYPRIKELFGIVRYEK